MPQAMPNLNALKVYQPRNPRDSGYYKCVETHFEEREQIWMVDKCSGLSKPRIYALLKKYDIPKS
jgi:hypothetical protein